MKAGMKYESPEAEVILFEFESEDIITSSDEAGHSAEAAAEDTRLPRI